MEKTADSILFTLFISICNSYLLHLLLSLCQNFNCLYASISCLSVCLITNLSFSNPSGRDSYKHFLLCSPHGYLGSPQTSKRELIISTTHNEFLLLSVSDTTIQPVILTKNLKNYWFVLFFERLVHLEVLSVPLHSIKCTLFLYLHCCSLTEATIHLFSGRKVAFPSASPFMSSSYNSFFTP